ncbi:MAG: porin [Rhodoferax sp.]|uniref:porin n=1 Tax=Rhodoferax sp. TaxID=50421 RepID=UPI00262A945F|nr:porin [Rhodoferax sp.]MDD2880870.1 porin [Rhodoferax sp.]
MKKSLIALAVMAASGASFAQSSVTLYGLADIWFGSVKSTNGVAGTSLTQTKMDSGGVNTSRWGMKGSEDLGGGLKANFKLEQGFQLDDGTATSGQAFSREAYVGFSGGFGEVKLGKVWTAYDDVSGASNAVFDSKLAPLNWVFVSTGYAGNPGNTIYYATPSFSGFAGAISYSLGENKTATASASATTSFNVTYGAGPVAVQLGYQVEDKDNSAAGSADAKFTRLGGSYDLGVAALKATYGKVNNVGGNSGYDATEYQLGVDFPVSSALTLSASYAKSDDSNPTGVYEQSRKGYGIAAAYTLSKRTFLYGGYTDNKFTNAGGFGDDKVSILAVGVQHKF